MDEWMSMDEPLFQQRPLRRPNLLERLLGRQPRENAQREVETRLANQPSRQVSAAAIQAIAERYRLVPERDLYPHLVSFYRRYLRYCLADHHLSEDELQDLAHLKTIFRLPEQVVRDLHDQVVTEVYRHSLNEALADGELDPQERRFLSELKETLCLPDALVEQLHAESSQVLLSRLHETSATAGDSLDEAQAAQFEALIQQLELPRSLSEATPQSLAKYKLFWQLENGQPPDIPTPGVELYVGELGLLALRGNWYEFRHGLSLPPGRPSIRTRTLRGGYWQAAGNGLHPIRAEELALAESGTLYLTTHRLAMHGRREKKVLRLASITDFEPYANGLAIRRRNGADSFLAVPQHADLLAMMMGHAITQPPG